MEVNKGKKAEGYVYNFLEQEGLNPEIVDLYYDIDASGIKIEVKSTLPSLKNGAVGCRGEFRKIGRFNFDCNINRSRLYNNESYTAFVIHYKDELMLLGFINNRDLWKDEQHVERKRYFSIHDILDNPKLMSKGDFIRYINGDSYGNMQ